MFGIYAQCTANDFPTPAPKHGPQAVTEQHAPTAVDELPVGFEVGDQCHGTTEDGDVLRCMDEVVAHSSNIFEHA